MATYWKKEMIDCQATKGRWWYKKQRKWRNAFGSPTLLSDNVPTPEQEDALAKMYAQYKPGGTRIPPHNYVSHFKTKGAEPESAMAMQPLGGVLYDRCDGGEEAKRRLGEGEGQKTKRRKKKKKSKPTITCECGKRILTTQMQSHRKGKDHRGWQRSQGQAIWDGNEANQ